MAAKILDIADAIVTQLNAATLSQAFTAVRGYLPTFELEDFDTLQVTVVPKADDGKLDTRSQSIHDYAIDIGIQKRFDAITNDNLDPLVLLTEEIADFFRFNKAPGSVTLLSPKTSTLYLQGHLRDLQQFTAVVTLGFKGWRSA